MVVGHAEKFFPAQRPVLVQTGQVSGAEQRAGHLALGRKAWRRVARVFIDFGQFNGRTCRRAHAGAPQQFARVGLETKHLPRFLVRAAEVDPVFPDHGRIKSLHRHLHLPENLFPRGNVPLHRRGGIVGFAQAAGPPEVRPLPLHGIPVGDDQGGGLFRSTRFLRCGCRCFRFGHRYLQAGEYRRQQRRQQPQPAHEHHQFPGAAALQPVPGRGTRHTGLRRPGGIMNRQTQRRKKHQCRDQGDQAAGPQHALRREEGGPGQQIHGAYGLDGFSRRFRSGGELFPHLNQFRQVEGVQGADLPVIEDKQGRDEQAQGPRHRSGSRCGADHAVICFERIVFTPGHDYPPRGNI
ncbi:MAG: hypothetical protein BWX80_01677 [Candidatus Hydrogenedentes bacterium ADurb.Bin101]|nr:MAG: hypothetical protein BWX80_01677 [Candidatus Hydrogenedentes bacterium ADurb.Bin101]